MVIAKGSGIYILNNPKNVALTKFENCKHEKILWSSTENQFDLGAVSSRKAS